jgi:hypothetical protein
MDSLKRIYLACRAAIAELGWLSYAWSLFILAGITTFLFLVNQDTDRFAGQLVNSYHRWDPEAMIGMLVVAGWIGGLILSSTIQNKFFKEENQAVRTLSLPLSNAERFATMMVLHLLFVPLLCFGIPLLFVFGCYPLLPAAVLLPAPVYLWLTLLIGWLAHSATTLLWFFPSVAMPKKIGFFILGGVATIIFYLNVTRNNLSDQIIVSHDISAPLAPDVYGLTDYEFHAPDRKLDSIEIGYEQNDSLVYVAGLSFLLLAVASGLAVTQKTA